MAMPLPKCDKSHDDKWRKEHAEQHDRALTDGLGATHVPKSAADDDNESPCCAAVAGGERCADVGHMAEIENEGDRVESHVKDAGGEREPGFLKSPEAAHGAAHPDVIAAFVGDGAGEL